MRATVARMAAVLAVALIPSLVGAGRQASAAGSEERMVCVSCSPPLAYGGGPVMGTSTTPGETTVYPIYWVPPGYSFDLAYTGFVDRFLLDVAADSGKTTNVFSVLTEYYQAVGGQQQKLSYLVHFGSHVDAADIPDSARAQCDPTDGTSTLCVTDDEVQSEVASTQSARGLPTGLGALYLVMLPPGVQVVDDTGSSAGFCGYHGHVGSGDGTLVYSVVPYASCTSGQSPNGNAAADSAADAVAHEITDAITDPLGNGWTDDAGNELADECADVYGPPLGTTGASGVGTAYTQLIDGDRFYVQAEYSNRTGGCEQRAGAVKATLNHVTVSASSSTVPADGKSTLQVTVNVTDPSGNPVPADQVTLQSTPLQAVQQTCGTLSPKETNADAQGSLSVTYTASLVNATCAVSASEVDTGAAGYTTLTQGAPRPVVSFIRQAGADRVATAVAISQMSYQQPASAQAVVLASDQSFADALPGGPLAAKLGGPLLITDPSGLSPAAEAEIKRVLPAQGAVNVVGGPSAVGDAVVQKLRADGFSVQRLSGPNRFATAVAVADAMGDPGAVVEASGLTFADALPGGPVASHLGGVVLLTNGSAQAPETAQYMTAHPGSHVALGGPAAAADPAATAVVGADRYDTAAQAAAAYFSSPTVVGLASGLAFPDALAGAAAMAAAGAPILLTDPTELPAPTAGYLNNVQATLTKVAVFGGQAAVANAVANHAARAG